MVHWTLVYYVIQLVQKRVLDTKQLMFCVFYDLSIVFHFPVLCRNLEISHYLSVLKFPFLFICLVYKKSTGCSLFSSVYRDRDESKEYQKVMIYVYPILTK